MPPLLFCIQLRITTDESRQDKKEADKVYQLLIIIKK